MNQLNASGTMRRVIDPYYQGAATMKRLLRALKTRVFLVGLVGGLTSAFGPVWAAVERGPAPDRAAFLASFGVYTKTKTAES